MSDLEDRIRQTLRDPARVLPPWRDPMPRVRREARRQRARLALITGAAAGVTVAAVLVTLVVLPGTAGRPPATRPSPAVTPRVPTSCREMPRALIKAELGIRRFVYTHTYRNLVVVGGPFGVGAPGFSCEFDGPGPPQKGLLIGVGTQSARRLAADVRAQQGGRVLHSVFGPGTSEFSVGPPSRSGANVMARAANGLVIVVTSWLTLRQDEAIIWQLFAAR